MQFRLHQPAYLNLKGGGPGANAVYVEADTIVGEGTAFDFEGPPSRAMAPLNDAAQAALDEAEAAYDGGPPTVKGTSAPPEGGASPFDPASPQKTDAEKAADEQKTKDEAAAKAAADAKKSGSK